MLSTSSSIVKRILILGILASMLACMRDAPAITPRQLVEVADLSDLAISPDGSSVAFRLQQASIERNAIDTVWYVQDIYGQSLPLRVAEGGYAVQAFWGLPAPAPAVWSPDGRWIYYRAMIDGKMDVWRAAADGSRAEPVTLDPADIRDFALSPDGRLLMYSVGATREQVIAEEERQYDYGVRIDKSVPVGQPLFRSGIIEGRLATQRYLGGVELNRASLLADVADHWRVINLETGQRRNAEPAEVPLHPALASFPASGQTRPFDSITDPQSGRVALLEPSGDGQGKYRQPYVELAVLHGHKARQPVKCQQQFCRDKAISGVQWRPGSDEVIFTVTDRDEGLAQSIFRWNVRSDSVRPVVQTRGLVNGGRDERTPCGVSAQVLICVTAEAGRPPRLERIELETGHRHTLFDPNAALAADITAATPVRFLRWKDTSGNTITGQFFAARRNNDRPPPLFVNYYSCSGFVRGGFGDEWPLASLAEHGISALCINYTPLQLDAVERYDGGLAVVTSAIELLASAGEIDRDRVGMGGLSLGTEMTLWTVVNSDLLTAAAVSSPVHSPLGYTLRRLYDDSYLPALRKYWQLGSPDETPERWQRISLAFNLNQVRAPILMQMPEHEYLASIDYAVPLIQEHKAELYVFPDEAHNKFQPRHKLAVYERSLDWFKFWLLDEEDPDMAKQEQYARWQIMKSRRERSLVPDS